MVYNMSGFTNANNILDIAVAVNSPEITGGLYGNLFLFGLFVILFAIFSKYDRSITFLGSTFIVSVVAILLTIAGLFDIIHITVPLIAFVVSLAVVAFK